MEQSHAYRHTQAFANISSVSVMPHEQEVLFSLLTHFRIKYVSESIVHPYRPWILIVLELVIDKKRESDYSHFYWVGKKFFAFFSKISWNNRGSSKRFHSKGIYRGYEYLSKNN